MLALMAIVAHAAEPTPSGAGAVLQQAQPPLAPSVAPSSGPEVRVEQPSSGAAPSSEAFFVKRIDITGNSRIDTKTLHRLVENAEGRQETLADLGELSTELTDYYHAHGYPLARAVIPAQTIQDGVVRMEIIEARYGEIVLTNHSRVADGLLRATLSGLQSGAVVTQAQMDRSLLLLSDIPGVTIHATLEPGTTTGTSNLLVDASSTSFVTGNVFADNGGDRYTGRARLGVTMQLINALHLGDVLTASGLTSGAGMNYGRLGYEALLNGAGTRAGTSWSALRYRLGDVFSSLNVHGTAQVGSVWAKQPLVRSRTVNVYAQLQYDHLMLNDDIDVSGIRTKRHLDNMTASVSGDFRDGVLAGGTNAWSASWTYGHVSFDDAAAQSADATGADIQGGFSKWNLGASRLQSFGRRDALYLSVVGQWASANLDPSQQLLVGGANTVRAYDTSAIGGDAGYLLNVEYRHTLSRSWHGQWQAIAFFDGAHVKVLQMPFVVGSNTANLTGVGVGLNWAGPYRISASASIATPVGGRPELVGNAASVRAWLQISKGL